MINLETFIIINAKTLKCHKFTTIAPRVAKDLFPTSGMRAYLESLTSVVLAWH